MKRIFTDTALFFSFCFIGTIAGALFSMLCMDLTQFVISTKLSLFSPEFFLKGIYLSFPLVAIISLLLLVMYQIRHPIHSIPTFIGYFVLNAITWLILIPLMLLLSLRTDIRPPAAAPSVSPGYFRTENDLVYYWSKFSNDGKGEGLCIDLYGLKGKPGNVYPLHNASKPEQKTLSTFADNLVRSAINMPLCVSIPFNAYLHLLYRARDALARGYLSWLLFASLGLALTAVYALKDISSWRLLNAFIVIITGVSIALLNYALYADTFLKPLSFVWQRATGNFGIQFPFATFVNLFIAIVFSAIGITRYFTHKDNEEATL